MRKIDILTQQAEELESWIEQCEYPPLSFMLIPMVLEVGDHLIDELENIGGRDRLNAELLAGHLDDLLGEIRGLA